MAILIAFSKKKKKYHSNIFCINPFSCIDSCFQDDFLKELFFMGKDFIWIWVNEEAIVIPDFWGEIPSDRKES